jgi:hypothetical protein
MPFSANSAGEVKLFDKMSLATGTRLGPYEIIARIGAGGRGEVYGARDTKMKRDVALKVLPDAFASDPERIARFQREAEVLTSLKPSQHRAHSRHPSERFGDGLVEGETLPCPLLVETAYIMTVEDCSIYCQSDRGGYEGYRDPPDPGLRYRPAYDVWTGNMIWETRRRAHRRPTTPASSRTAGGLVFYGETGGSFAAADAKTGKILWRSRAISPGDLHL